MSSLKVLIGVAVSYVPAAYVSELVSITIPNPNEPTYGMTADSQPNWSLFWHAPGIVPIRYLFVGISTIVGGRESFENPKFAVPFAVLIVAWVGLFFLFRLLHRAVYHFLQPESAS